MQEEFWNLETLCHKNDPRDLVKLLKQFFWLDTYDKAMWPYENLFLRYKRTKNLILLDLDKTFDGNGFIVYSKYKNMYHHLSNDDLLFITKISEVVKKHEKHIHDIALDGMTLLTLFIKKVRSISF